MDREQSVHIGNQQGIRIALHNQLDCFVRRAKLARHEKRNHLVPPLCAQRQALASIRTNKGFHDPDKATIVIGVGLQSHVQSCVVVAICLRRRCFVRLQQQLHHLITCLPNSCTHQRITTVMIQQRSCLR